MFFLRNSFRRCKSLSPYCGTACERLNFNSSREFFFGGSSIGFAPSVSSLIAFISATYTNSSVTTRNLLKVRQTTSALVKTHVCKTTSPTYSKNKILVKTGDRKISKKHRGAIFINHSFKPFRIVYTGSKRNLLQRSLHFFFEEERACRVSLNLNYFASNNLIAIEKNSRSRS